MQPLNRDGTPEVLEESKAVHKHAGPVFLEAELVPYVCEEDTSYSILFHPWAMIAAMRRRWSSIATGIDSNVTCKLTVNRFIWMCTCEYLAIKAGQQVVFVHVPSQ